MPIDQVIVASKGLQSLGAAAKPASKLTKVALDKFIVSFTDCFKNSTNYAKDECSKIKNIIYRKESANLIDKYVSVNFLNADQVISDKTVADHFFQRNRILISGSAGFGKTMFVKWATLRLIEKTENLRIYPFYLELRYLTEAECAQAFEKTLYDRLAPRKGKPNFEQFMIALNNGLFAFTFDAIDEINPGFRSTAVNQIQRFLADFPLCPVLMSSRPDDSLESIPLFEVYQTLPMTKEQVIDVIKKLDYIEDVKEKLINHLNNGLFEAQEDFLVSPLLATIMLLTFDNSASIPAKASLFYKEAFETLYYRHDSHKGAFKRGHHAGLPIDEFERIFSHFCYQTLKSASLEFSYSELLGHFRESVKFCEISVNPELVLLDTIESASLLIKDGAKYGFAHRSFQEYFCAKFIINYRGPDPWKLIDNLAVLFMGSNVLRMLFEMNSDFVESEWVLRRSQEWLGKVDRLNLNTKSGFSKFFKATFRSLGYNPSGNIGNFGMLSGLDGCNWMATLGDIYPDRRFARRVFGAKLTPFSEIEHILKSREIYSKHFEGFKSEIDQERLARGDYYFEAPDVDEAGTDWLLFSGLPDVFVDIRDDVRKTVKQIEQRKRRLQKIIEA